MRRLDRGQAGYRGSVARSLFWSHRRRSRLAATAATTKHPVCCCSRRYSTSDQLELSFASRRCWHIRHGDKQGASSLRASVLKVFPGGFLQHRSSGNFLSVSEANNDLGAFSLDFFAFRNAAKRQNMGREVAAWGSLNGRGRCSRWLFVTTTLGLQHKAKLQRLG
jgi:hypothetical protein